MRLSIADQHEDTTASISCLAIAINNHYMGTDDNGKRTKFLQFAPTPDAPYSDKLITGLRSTALYHAKYRD